MFRRSRRVTALCLATVLMALVVFSGKAATPPLIINEILIGNAGTNLDNEMGNFSGWIEVRNTTGKQVHLKKYKLESWPDGATTPDTVILKGGVVPAGGYLLLWADEVKKGHNHLAFNLDMDGGELRLTAPNGDYDHISFHEQSVDVSIGRDSGGNWGVFYDTPTPGAANTTPAYPDNDEDDNFAAIPEFSIEGGLHTGEITVELSSDTPGATIRYTRDASRPTAASPLYTDPITVDDTTIIRARAWADGLMVSPTATESYFVGIDANLAIVSIVTDDANLYDPRMGIYTQGVNGSKKCQVKANWHQSWERPANIEFYEKVATDAVDQVINQEVGFEIFGNCTRNYPQKSLEIKARKLYGDNDMDYPFFAAKPMTSYRRLVLRNAGQDNNNTFMRDALAQTLSVGRMDIDRQAYRPVIVYLNGEYWGIYNMREKGDEDYVENNYDLDEDAFDMLSLPARRVTNGSLDAWRDVEAFLRKNALTAPAAYTAIQQMIDVDSFIDYIILETYVANTDWPKNNTRWWDDHADDHRWRWLLVDLDASFMAKNVKLGVVRSAQRGGGATSLLFNKLWASPDFRNEFAQRYAAHLNTTFQPARVIGIIDSMADGIRDEMLAHIDRWQRPASPAIWEEEVQKLRVFAEQRPFYARDSLRKSIGKPGDAILTLHTLGDGQVLVAGAAVPGGYSGPHFRNIPITLTAAPAPGQLFVRWEETGETTATITLPFNGDTTRTAVFGEEPPPPPPPNLVINELHHTPPVDDNVYEFLEIYNADDHTVDLSGFSLVGVDFTFPDGASIAAGEYIVVADTPASYPGSYQVFDFDGGLSSSGETVSLIDTLARVVDSVTYSSTSPWPSTPNAGGPSLSLLDPVLNNSLAENWAASANNGGTPGAINYP